MSTFTEYIRQLTDFKTNIQQRIAMDKGKLEAELIWAHALETIEAILQHRLKVREKFIDKLTRMNQYLEWPLEEFIDLVVGINPDDIYMGEHLPTYTKHTVGEGWDPEYELYYRRGVGWSRQRRTR